MGKIVMVTGGTRSGKSSFAEGLLKDENSILYIATGKITDDEMAERVRHHQERRGERYRTYEGYEAIPDAIRESAETATMLECIGTMVTNMMFDEDRDLDRISIEDVKQMEERIVSAVSDIIGEMKKTNQLHMVITNEVGFALISEYKLGRIFTDILGRVNQFIARHADEVYLVVSGLPVKVKG